MSNYQKRLVETAQRIAAAIRGDRLAQAVLTQEAQSTADFPELFRKITEDQILGDYAVLPKTWTAYSRRTTMRNFKPETWKRWTQDMSLMPESNGGAVNHGEVSGHIGLPRVPELTEYPVFSIDSEGGSYQLGKHGGRYAFSMEALINDEWDIISRMPTEMAAMAANTEQILTTMVLTSGNGVNTKFFNVTNGNLMPGNPPLSREAVAEAIAMITTRKVNGRPVTVGNFALVVPPALSMLANDIMAATEIKRESTLPDGTIQTLTTQNTYPAPVTVVVDPWLGVLDEGVNAATTWYLVPSGGETGVGGRTSIVTAFLSGHEQPSLRVSGNTGRAIGGGEIPAEDGSFLNDDVQYRIRHFIGAAGIDPSPTIASNGSGT